MMESLRRWAEHVVDTTNYSSNDLQQEIRQRFADAEDDEPALNIVSFGFARGLPRHAALGFDMRYLRNPHRNAKLRHGTGLDADVSTPIAEREREVSGKNVAASVYPGIHLLITTKPNKT